eukprot:scaffold28832_cov82-Isochrysis_galbana.AAC.2
MVCVCVCVAPFATASLPRGLIRPEQRCRPLHRPTWPPPGPGPRFLVGEAPPRARPERRSGGRSGRRAAAWRGEAASGAASG